MADYGIKVSLPDSDTTSDADELVMSSAYPSPKVQLGVSPAHFDYESYTIPANPSAGTTTNLVSIPHGYTYTPANLVLVSFDQTYFKVGSFVSTDLVFFEDRYHCYCDETAFKIDVERVALGGPYPNLAGTVIYYKYYIFAEDGV